MKTTVIILCIASIAISAYTLFQKKNIGNSKDLLSKEQIDNIKHDYASFYKKREWVFQKALKQDIANAFLISMKSNKNKSTLFFFFSQKSCQSCINVEYNNLKSYFTDDSVDIKLLCFAESNRYIKVLEKQGYNEYPIMPVNKNLFLNIEEDIQTTPCYFILNQRNELSDLFIPDKFNNNLTKKYLMFIKDTFFKNNK